MRTEEQKIRRKIYDSTPESRARQRQSYIRQRMKNGFRIFGEAELRELRQRCFLAGRNPVANRKRRESVLSLGAKHPSAMAWSLKDPSGTVHQFKNLSRFVSENRHLFTEEQLRPTSARHPSMCRAASELMKLSPRRKDPRSTAIGWMWHVNNTDYGLLT